MSQREGRSVVSAADHPELSLIQLAVLNVGVLRVGNALALLACWCIARHKIGPEMDAESYGEWWKMSRSQAFRDQAKMRQAFPDVDPEKVYRVTESTYRAELARCEAEHEKRQAVKLANQLAGVQVVGLT